MHSSEVTGTELRSSSCRKVQLPTQMQSLISLVLSAQPEQVPTIAYYLPKVRHFGTPIGPVADPRVVDWRGALLALAGLGSLVYGLIAAPERGWSDPIVIADSFWRHHEVVAALRNRYVGRLFELLHGHTGASQDQISNACGMSQGKVSHVIRGLQMLIPQEDTLS